MKIFISGMMVMLILLLGGCTGQKSESHIEEKSAMEDRMVVTAVQTKEEIKSINEDAPSIAIGDSKEDDWLKYAEKLLNLIEQN